MEPWECPRCHKIWAGWVSGCSCSPPTYTATTNTPYIRLGVYGSLVCNCHLQEGLTASASCPVHDMRMTGGAT